MKLFNSFPLIYRKIIFIAFLLICLTPFIDAPLALLLGFLLAQIMEQPFGKSNAKFTSLLLKISVVGLGFGINLTHAMEVGKEGILLTFLSILVTLICGLLLGRLLKVNTKISFLLSGGTAICGGSAIAALAPIIKADEKQISVALGVIFVLNSVALFLFPFLGQLLNMSQHQFGLWSAIAIHDTSSVVGASAKFGHEALQIATTVKLERALWIIPVSIFTAIAYKGESKSIKIPYFIGFFILAMCIGTFLPQLISVYDIIIVGAKKGLTVTLFLIGTGLSLNNIKSVGARPLIQGVVLWLFISSISLFFILWGSRF